MKNETITHPGIIRKIGANLAEVSIIVNSGCASCSVKGSCSISDVKEKVVEVGLSGNDEFAVGQHVRVEMKQSLGSWAVLLGYFFPFLVVLAGLILFTTLEIDQGLAALASLGLLIPYYLVLYLTRNRLRRKFTYVLHPSGI